MNWKEMLKPNMKNVVLAIVLFAAVTWSMNILMRDVAMDVIIYGFPLEFYSISTFPCIAAYGCTGHTPTISYAAIVIDLLVWYVIACILIFAFEKKPAKRGNKK